MPETSADAAHSPAMPPRVSPRVFARIPTVRTADELIDTAFRRASRITVHQKDAFSRLKATEIARVRSVQNGLAAALQKYVKRFPSFDGLPNFYQELVHLLVDLDKVRKALGSLDWASKRIDEIGDETVREIKRAPHAEVALKAKSQGYGRISSILKQVDPHLRRLDEARRAVRRLPVIEHDNPTIVIAGYPNVGKSSLVRAISTGTPEVASYPFTTKGIVVGHFDRDHVRYQLVDTPGLLDRELDARNPIEMQAIHALRHLGNVIVFLVDPSEHCGYTLDAQLKLLEDTRNTFPDTPVLVAESKADIKTSGVGELAFSSETGEGVDDVVRTAIERMRQR